LIPHCASACQSGRPCARPRVFLGDSMKVRNSVTPGARVADCTLCGGAIAPGRRAADARTAWFYSLFGNVGNAWGLGPAPCAPDEPAGAWSVAEGAQRYFRGLINKESPCSFHTPFVVPQSRPLY